MRFCTLSEKQTPLGFAVTEKKANIVAALLDFPKNVDLSKGVGFPV